MGLFDWLKGTRGPEPGVQPRSAQDVGEALLALNRPTAPWLVRRGGPDEPDLVAEWRIVDASWYEIFRKAGLSKVFRVLMRLDPAAHEVRAVDEEWSVEWQAGVPSLSRVINAFRGQKVSVQFGTAFAFQENLRPGVVYDYRFDTRELKEPLKTCVTNSGWTWRGVAFGKL